MHPQQIGLIVNRAPNGVLNEGTREEIEKQGLTLLGVVPHDDQVYEYDCDGKPTVRLPEDSPVQTDRHHLPVLSGLPGMQLLRHRCFWYFCIKDSSLCPLFHILKLFSASFSASISQLYRFLKKIAPTPQIPIRTG